MTARRKPDIDNRTQAVIIVGAGLSGLGTAVALLESGVRDIVILERGAVVGESVRSGGLPGAPCDVPSLLYPYAFKHKPRWPQWSGERPTGTEVGGYAQRLVERFSLGQFIRFGEEVKRLEYDESASRWVARTAGGRQFAARSVVVALSAVSVARKPDIRGLDRFAGKSVYSAEWDDSLDLSGQRVAVVGTGASGVQLVPELVKRVGLLKVFQRTPRWVLPWPGHTSAAWDKALLRTVPYSQAAARYAVLCAHEPWALNGVVRSTVVAATERVAKAHMRRQVQDPWMRRLLTPDYRPGCRPILVSSEFYPALQRKNSELVAWPIATVSEAGIRTSDGLEHHVDTIVFATGSDVAGVGTRLPIVGRDGQVLARAQTDGAGAYKGVSVSGFPNMFLIPGPGSGPAQGSALVYMDAQIDYAVRALSRISNGTVRSLDVRHDVQTHYDLALRRRLSTSLWGSGCTGGYLAESGFSSMVYPGVATEYATQMAKVQLSDYTVESSRNGHVAESALNGKV